MLNFHLPATPWLPPPLKCISHGNFLLFFFFACLNCDERIETRKLRELGELT